MCEAHATMKQELRERSKKLPPLTHTPLRTVISASVPPLTLIERPLSDKFKSGALQGEVILINIAPSLRQEQLWWWWSSVDYGRSTTSRERVLWEKDHLTQVKVEEEQG